MTSFCNRDSNGHGQVECHDHEDSEESPPGLVDELQDTRVDDRNSKDHFNC